jgi:hypothetical protein
MCGWPASNDFHHFPSKLLIVSVQLSIQNVHLLVHGRLASQ